MNKRLRKTLAIILALTMCLSSGIMAMAQDNMVLANNMADIPTFAVASDAATFKSAVSSNVELIIITNNISINETIIINHDITFAAATELSINLLTVAGSNVTLTFQNVSTGSIKSTAALLTIIDGKHSSVSATGSLTINGGTYGNSSRAIYCEGTFTMEDGIIENCYNVVAGAGIYSTGTVNINGGEIRNNYAGYKSSCYGGGIYVKDGTLNISGGVIRENRVTGFGAGIYIENSVFRMDGGAILYNESEAFSLSSEQGGGIYAVNCKMFLNAGLIVGNTVTSTSQRGTGIYAVNCTLQYPSTGIGTQIYDDVYQVSY